MYSQRIPNNLSGRSLSKSPRRSLRRIVAAALPNAEREKGAHRGERPRDRGRRPRLQRNARFERAHSFANLRASNAERRLDPEITPEVVEEHGLTPEEFARIKKILGREPNFTELGIFSVMWSEHCSYKNSRRELKKFPTTGPNILVKAGEENAGVVDIGDGWAIAFKIESHNHPSAIEPFQGAATGVGGIIRDIFTMGARPEFCLNSLRFGPISVEISKS